MSRKRRIVVPVDGSDNALAEKTRMQGADLADCLVS
jgi:hypothetical protein